MKKNVSVKKIKPNVEADHIATAKAYNLPISTKQSIEICDFLRYKKLQSVKTILDNAMQKKSAKKTVKKVRKTVKRTVKAKKPATKKRTVKKAKKTKKRK